MKDKYLYYIEIICVIFLICFAFFMFVNIKRVYSDNKADNNVKNTNNYDSLKYHKINDLLNDNVVKKQDVPPPKLVNIYNEPIKSLPNKNNIDLINKNKINIYKEDADINNPNFNKEVILQNDIKTKEQRAFSEELENVYTTDIADNINPEIDYTEIYDYSTRPNKSDLPIKNVPMCLLKRNVNSYRFSDNFVV
jgi:Ca2+/Na+ antiporter